MVSSPPIIEREGVSDIKRFRSISGFAIDLVYPRRCAGCGRRGSWLCSHCEQETALFAPPWCHGCGIPNVLPCACHALPDDVERIRSVGPFDGWLRGAVIQCKYHGEWARVSGLAPGLAAACETLRPFDFLVPVPLHPTRMRQRGFNQSLLLARGVSDILQMPVEECIVRARRTDSQARLAAGERWQNVEGSIAVKPGSEIAGRAYVLIDDVVTTGATLAACAAALKQAGAASVMAATVCREL